MTDNYSTLAAISPLLLLLIGLSITVMIDPYIRREHRRVMLIIAALLVTLVAQNVLDFWVEQDSTQRVARTILGIYGYSVRPAVLVLFLYLFGTKRRIWPFWALVGVARVAVTPIGVGTDPAAKLVTYFVIVPPKPEDTTLTTENGALHIAVKDLSEIAASGYEAEYRLKDTDQWTVVPFEAGQTELLIKGLAAGE